MHACNLCGSLVQIASWSVAAGQNRWAHVSGGREVAFADIDPVD